MDEITTGKMTPFDAMVSKDSLQILKATLPYLPGKTQYMLAVYAKFSELTNTIAYFRRASNDLQMMSSERQLQPQEFLSDLLQYTHGPMNGAIEQMLFTINAIQLMQTYQDLPDQGPEVF